MVMSKSAEDYVVSWFLARLTEWGCTTIRLRVQKDNPMKAIAKRVKEGRSEMTILEEAPVASPQAHASDTIERYRSSAGPYDLNLKNDLGKRSR